MKFKQLTVCFQRALAIHKIAKICDIDTNKTLAVEEWEEFFNNQPFQTTHNRNTLKVHFIKNIRFETISNQEI